MSQTTLKPTPLDLADFASDITVGLTQNLVRVPSITAIDAKDRPASIACLDILAQAAERSGAKVERLAFEGGHAKWSYPVDNIYIEWNFGTAKQRPHICYMGHVDVVPPGQENAWSDGGAFSGAIRDGYLYGRGTTDMKGSVAAFITAVTEQIPALSKKNLTISILITADEEWAAVNGSRKVLQWMKDNGKTPDAFVVGEPSSQDILGSHIKVGRRGSLCGTLQIKGRQGHAAYPGLFENPNRALSLALTILNQQKWSDGNAYFPNTNFEPIALQSGNFNASAVVPGQADVLWNIRYTPEHSPQSLEKLINDLLQNAPLWARQHPDFSTLSQITVVANKDTASVPYYSAPKHLAEKACAAVKDVLGITPQIDGSGGTTDGRFVQQFFPDAEIIELGVPERGGFDQNNQKPNDYLAKGGMHQIDERVSLRDLVNLRLIFENLIASYDKN